MSETDHPAILYECGSCGTLGFGTGEVECCGERMDPIRTEETTVDDPDLELLLRSVFGMSPTELDVCLCVMEAGETTIAELAEEIGYERSVVSRHLNHLADLGVVEKRRRLLERGGQVYVYTPVDPESIRRRLLRNYLAWVTAGSSLIEELSREKIEAIVELDAADPAWKIFETS